jgi:hypothetical protein
MTDAPPTKQTSRRDLAKQGDAIQLVGQRACDRCGKPFMPRTGSGGSAQRFCSTDCRLSFHTERLRSQRATTYAGQTALPATPHSATRETLTRSPAVAALHPWQSGVLDIADCQRTEFVVALKDGETASTQVETWPAEVRTFMDQHVGRWLDENKDARNVHTITVAAPNYDNIQSCVTIRHHSRMDFEARQRTEVRAAYIEPTRLPLPQQPAAAALHPWETGVLEIVNCGRVEFILALKEGEAAGTGIETWPAEVRALIKEDVNRWITENKETRTVRAMTVAAPKYHGIQSCVLILHHSPRHTPLFAGSSEPKALRAVLAGRKGVS